MPSNVSRNPSPASQTKVVCPNTNQWAFTAMTSSILSLHQGTKPQPHTTTKYHGTIKKTQHNFKFYNQNPEKDAQITTPKQSQV